MKSILALTPLVLLLAVVGCASAPTPTPTPLPTRTPAPTATSEPVGDYVPSDVPRCQGVKMLDRALKFEWVGVDAVGDGAWYYYHCDQKPGDLATLYRPVMIKAPYEWGEINWVERPEGTLGVYFNTVRQNWLYLWFLSDTTSAGGSYLVVAEQGQIPLDLPCCH
jgi:hypothetical protein